MIGVDIQNQEEEDVIVDEVEDGEVVESTTSEPAVYYDSSKSFFDSISCEANKPLSDRYIIPWYTACVNVHIYIFTEGQVVTKKNL